MEKRWQSTEFASTNSREFCVRGRGGPVSRVGKNAFPSGPPALPDLPALLSRDHKVSPPILLPARLVLLVTERLLFTLADDGDAAGRDSETHQIIFHGIRAPRAEPEVVFGATP